MQHKKNHTRRRTVAVYLRLFLFPLVLLLMLTQHQQGGWLSIDRSFSPEQQKIIRQAAYDWDQKYHCNRSVSVKPVKGETAVLSDGSKERTLEYADPGIIELDPNQNLHQIRNTILHAMTHACQKDKPYLLPTKFLMEKGVWAYGYHGASVLVESEKNKKTAFRKLEEAICERNASYFKGYTTTDRRYFAIGKLARKHFPPDSPVVEWVKENDVPAIVGSVVGKPKEEINFNDILAVCDMYQNTWNSKEYK